MVTEEGDEFGTNQTKTPFRPWFRFRAVEVARPVSIKWGHKLSNRAHRAAHEQVDSYVRRKGGGNVRAAGLRPAHLLGEAENA